MNSWHRRSDTNWQQPIHVVKQKEQKTALFVQQVKKLFFILRAKEMHLLVCVVASPMCSIADEENDCLVLIIFEDSVRTVFISQSLSVDSPDVSEDKKCKQIKERVGLLTSLGHTEAQQQHEGDVHSCGKAALLTGLNSMSLAI